MIFYNIFSIGIKDIIPAPADGSRECPAAPTEFRTRWNARARTRRRAVTHGSGFLFVSAPTACLRLVSRLRTVARGGSRVRRRASPQHDTSAFPYFVADRRARLHFLLCALALAMTIAGPAAAEDDAVTGGPADPPATRIELDRQGQAVRIFAGGTERVTIGAEGLHVNGGIEYTAALTDLSDARLKADIRPLAGQGEALLSLRPVAFTMADDPQDKTEYGLLAQEVEPIYPALVETRSDGGKAVNYPGLIAPLIAAVQELRADNARLRVRVEALEAGAQ